MKIYIPLIRKTYLFPRGSYLSTKYLVYKINRHNFAFQGRLITLILITNVYMYGKGKHTHFLQLQYFSQEI